MAKKSDVLPILKNAAQADNVDYRKFIDLDEVEPSPFSLYVIKNFSVKTQNLGFHICRTLDLFCKYVFNKTLPLSLDFIILFFGF